MLYAGAVGKAEAGGKSGCCAGEGHHWRGCQWDYSLKHGQHVRVKSRIIPAKNVEGAPAEQTVESG